MFYLQVDFLVGHHSNKIMSSGEWCSRSLEVKKINHDRDASALLLCIIKCTCVSALQSVRKLFFLSFYLDYKIILCKIRIKFKPSRPINLCINQQTHKQVRRALLNYHFSVTTVEKFVC